jgi:hypothetical protein
MMKKKPVPSKGLRAGAAMVDITPAKDIQLAGDIGRRRPVEEIRERIYAKALVMGSGGEQLCLLSLEVCFVTDKWVSEIRKRASERFGLAPQAIMVHSIQNHAAPAIGNAAVRDEYKGLGPDLWWLRSGDKRYNEPAISVIVDAIGKAQAQMVPVTVRAGRALDSRVAFNRRFVLRDGTAIAHPHGEDQKQILYSEGPMDPEVGVLLLQAADGRIVAALLHHTCHPVHGYPHRYVIADWPGTWASAMRGALGADCVALVINGCCGNIHHHNHTDPRHIDDHIRMGSMLAESAYRAIQASVPQTETTLGWRSEILRIPYRELPTSEVEAARRLLAKQPKPAISMAEGYASIPWDWIYAHTVLDLAEHLKSHRHHAYEVQAFRIANSAVVALVGEPFVEGQLQVKLRSPFPFTFLAHMSNGYVGYIPTAEAIARGGTRSFETRPSNWSKLVPPALDMIAEKSLELLRQLATGR